MPAAWVPAADEPGALLGTRRDAWEVFPMTLDRHRFPPATAGAAGEPFGSPEEAWFWSVQAHEAKAAGARVTAGRGLVARPCEPGDVLRAVDRLYRQRRLVRDHLHVLVHYGRRLIPPDPDRHREQRASALWREAFAHLGPLLREKGIVQGSAVQ